MTDRTGSQRTGQAQGAAFGLCAAALFGLSAPIAKVLLGSVPPVLLAGLLYLGAAVGLWLHRVVAPPTKEARLGRADAPKLALVVLAGGIAGPVLMLFGLERVTALTGSLLLNLEAPFTVAAAVLFGSLSYGASVVLDAYALRLIGAAREAAYFATAPFDGALASVVLLGDSLGIERKFMFQGRFFYRSRRAPRSIERHRSP